MVRRIKEIWRYPIKSCAGESLAGIDIVETGPRFDREWMIVDDSGHFLTQRQIPALCLVRAWIMGEALVVNAPSRKQLIVPIRYRFPTLESVEVKRVEIWKQEFYGLDEGEAAADWFSAQLGRSCSLVRALPHHHNQRRSRQGLSSAPMNFPDGYPVHVIGTASMGELERRLGTACGQNRFRPNFLVETKIGHEEDCWLGFSVGSVMFQGFGYPAGQTKRCEIPGIDQATAKKAREPLATLAKYRRGKDGNKLVFGAYFNQRTLGPISVGDEVKVLEKV